MPAPSLSFSSPDQLFKAAMSMKLVDGANDKPLLCPGVTYSVRGRPMKLNLEPSGDTGHRLRLVRTDWETLSRLERFVAAVLSACGLAAPAEAAATKEQTAALLGLMGEILRQDDKDNDLLTRERRTAAMASNMLKDALASRDGDAIQSASRTRADALAALENRIVFKYQHRLRDVLPALRQLYIEQPLRIANEARQAMLVPVLEDLGTDMAECARVGLNGESRARIAEKLGVAAQVGTWRRVAATVTNSAERRARIEAAERVRTQAALPARSSQAPRVVDLRFDLSTGAIPVEQADLPQTCEIAFGDMHGNCQLMLQTLVKLGFMRVRNAQAWEAANKMLALVDSPGSNHDYHAFRKLLKIALEANPNGSNRKLVLLGDLLSDRVHHDMFMLAIFDRMDAAGMDFDIIFSNHDSEFIAYYLNNKDKGDGDAYVMLDIGLGISEHSATSLHRLHALMNVGLNGVDGADHVRPPDAAAQRQQARLDLRRWTEDVYLKHLKLLSCSRDASCFYSHGFVNRPIVAAIGQLSGVDPALPLPARLDHINAWFHSEALTEPALYKLLTHEGTWQLEKHRALRRHFPVSPIRLAAWNIAHDEEKFTTGIEHPHASAIQLPGETVLRTVHGHTQSVGARLRRQIDGTATPLAALETLRNPEMSQDYLKRLNSFLRTLTHGVDPKLYSVAASAILFVLRSLPAAAPTLEPAVLALKETILGMGNDPGPARNALTAFWNEHCVSQDNSEGPLNTLDRGIAQELSVPAAWRAPVDAAAVNDGIDRVIPALKAKVAAFDKAAKAHISPEDETILARAGDPPAARRDAYLREIEARYISLDSPDGQVKSEEAFTRQAHIV